MPLKLQFSVLKKRQKKFYSGKKKRHTIKTQLVVNKDTRQIICVYTTNGKTHDFKACKESKLPLSSKTIVATDSGYQGLQRLHLNTELPTKKSKTKPLTKEAKQANKNLASKRAFNEHVNGVVKVFKIIAEKYRNRRRRFNLRFNLIAGIYNFELNCG